MFVAIAPATPPAPIGPMDYSKWDKMLDMLTDSDEEEGQQAEPVRQHLVVSHTRVVPHVYVLDCHCRHLRYHDATQSVGVRHVAVDELKDEAIAPSILSL